MIKTAIGLILLLSPFLLTRRFADKKIGFSYVMAFSMTFHLSVAVLTQAMQIFTYPVILSINLAVFLLVLFESKIITKKARKSIKENLLRLEGLRRSIRRIDWVLVFVAIVLFIQFFSVHYNYSGKYSMLMIPEYQQARNMVYPYPYYSDEWYSVAFIKHSINTHSLPLVNPLDHNRPFINLEFPFHSFLSEMMLLMDMDPLTQYTQLTIFAGMLVCLLVYLLLQMNKVGRLPAAITSLSVPYIIDGANLPGLWTLIPIMLGSISMLLTFFFITANDRRMVLFMSVPTLLFYPPLFVFYAVLVLSYILSAKGISNVERMKSLSRYIALAVLAAVVLSATYLSAGSSFSTYFPDVSSRLFYQSFISDSIPQYPIYVIIPIPILLLSALGAYSIYKKKIWLISVLSLGVFYWILYSGVTFRIIFEYQRVVFFTSILIMIAAGFGLDRLLRYLKNRIFFQRKFNGFDVLDYLQAVILISLFLLSFSYTDRDDWQQLTLLNVKAQRTFMPGAPANRILQPDDLRLFENIKNQTFLSDPWKGTVIGVATDNFPVSTKPGTISNDRKAFFTFVTSDCSVKYETAKSRGIDYIYLPEFDCPSFKFIGSSNEGFNLYRFVE